MSCSGASKAAFWLSVAAVAVALAVVLRRCGVSSPFSGGDVACVDTCNVGAMSLTADFSDGGFVADSAGVDGLLSSFSEGGVKESFTDFVFDFSLVRTLQIRRVCFPLPVVTGADTVWMEAGQWGHAEIFSGEDFYTVFFNSAAQMEALEGCAEESDSVDVWLYDLEGSCVTVYGFLRKDGRWMLSRVRNRGYERGNVLDCFMEFYAVFVEDEEFQRLHVASPLRFVTTDPDDDFNTIEGTLDRDQWDFFKPGLARGRVSHIDYGQRFKDGRCVVMVQAGISNGLMDVLTFRRRGREWRLISYEN